MPPVRGLIKTQKDWIGKAIADPSSDPQRFFGTLYALPNPDPILRSMGRAEQVYFSIAADPHVLGDIRSVRGNFRSHQYRLVEGEEGTPQSARALELCQRWMSRNRPNHLADWLEVMWQMSSAFLTGYRVHERVWDYVDGALVPAQFIDRANRRFNFDAYAHTRLISTGNMLGEPVEPHLFAVSRHMADHENPYGVAVLSSCFWPWTFKTGGWRYFVKYCERHGLPWPWAKYPMGTDDKEQDKLAEALENMLEAGFIMTPEGTSLDFLEAKASSAAGGLPQERLIDLINREMSKAVTGQAMVAELQGTGARAASETAASRQGAIDDSVRDIAAQTMGDTFRWITLFNLGDGVAPPTLQFYRHENAGKDRAEAYGMVYDLGGNPSRRKLMEELGIPEAQGESDALDRRVTSSGQEMRGQAAEPAADAGAAATGSGRAGPRLQMSARLPMDLATLPGWQFASAAGLTEAEAMDLAATAADAAIEQHMIAPVARMLERYEQEGKTLQQFAADLEDMVGALDDTALREVLEQALQWSILRGAVTKAP